MVTVEEAKRLLFLQVQRSEVVEVDILQSLNCVLARDIFSVIDLPSFDQSSMDGYAVASGNDSERKVFDVIGEIKAGDDPTIELMTGQAVRIFTGAALPKGADSIVIQEKVEEKNGQLFLQENCKKGDCIRRKSSQIKKGDLALEKGSVINPAAIGFLASLGIVKVSIYKKPLVSIIVTGNEIIQAGEELTNGKIYESNSFSLRAALMQMGIEVNNVFTVEDEKEELRNKIETGLNGSDIFLITGGISVGKYDLVHGTLSELGVETIFYKVAQKPGKPFFAGKLKNKMIFALPGNPASGMVCFYEYVYPAIRMMRGFKNTALRSVRLKSLKEINKKEGRAVFIRAKTIEDGVMELEGQDSNMLRSFAQADAFIYIKQETQTIKQNEEVEVHLLPLSC